MSLQDRLKICLKIDWRECLYCCFAFDDLHNLKICYLCFQLSIFQICSMRKLWLLKLVNLTSIFLPLSEDLMHWIAVCSINSWLFLISEKLLVSKYFQSWELSVFKMFALVWKAASINSFDTELWTENINLI